MNEVPAQLRNVGDSFSGSCNADHCFRRVHRNGSDFQELLNKMIKKYPCVSGFSGKEMFQSLFRDVIALFFAHGRFTFLI
jgi:hypothetical protein